jgi:hypothetical protein
MDPLGDFLNKTVEYEDNNGYRRCMRELFKMKSENYSDKLNEIKRIEELDAETEDEISYDDESVKTILDIVYLKTKDNVLFNRVYILAAATFLSEDPSIGEAVLFSYHYLPLFYLCLVDYFKSPEDFNSENINYINLLKKIS